MKILIVEDEKNIVLSLKLMLEKMGHDVVCTRSGVEALEISRKISPDLVLLDIVLPGMDGFLVCQAMRKESDTSKTPIIFISALSREEDIKKALNAGANEYIVKPFTPEKIRETVEKWL
ncbi:MAG TPA: response regulator [Mesotoga sp.]|nr:response regulator [Mesotoga sp.]HNS68068.1 response regulator [Mesotoga infera]